MLVTIVGATPPSVVMNGEVSLCFRSVVMVTPFVHESRYLRRSSISVSLALIEQRYV